MTFLVSFIAYLILLFGVIGFLVYPLIAVESYDSPVAFSLLGLLIICAAGLAYFDLEGDKTIHNFDKETGVLTVDVHDSEKKVTEIRVNHVTTKREWKFF